MTDKELKRLSRAELLELLLIQTKETELLTKKLERAEAMLADRQLRMEKAGDIAHAVLEINGVMQAAQAAAQQYLENVRRMDQEASQRAEKIRISAQQEIDRAWEEIRQARKEIELSRQALEQARRETGKPSRKAERSRREAPEKPVSSGSEQDLISEIYTLLNGETKF